MKFFRNLLLGVMPAALMGCGGGAQALNTVSAVDIAHVVAAGHRLMVMRVGPQAQVRFVSHKQHNFEAAPDISNRDIAVNVAAAFTLDTETMDVCGDHVVAGERIEGYDDVTATGHMLIVNNKVSILPNSRLKESIEAAVQGKGYLFQQCYIVEDGKSQEQRIPQAIRERRPHIIYRAACTMGDGSLAIVQGGELMHYDEFINSLVALGAQQALYLDMGTWAWGWTRDANGKALELAEKFDNTRYQSNWLQILY